MVEDNDAFVKALEEGKTIEGHKGMGIWWSWDRDAAMCHGDAGAANWVTVDGWVSTENIDYTKMALNNLHPSYGEEEAEVTIKNGADVLILTVEDNDNNEIWDGEQIVKARVDKLPGGLADEKQPEDFPEAKLSQGIKVELEHTDDPDLALEITMDHLTEDLDYYDKLAQIEARVIVALKRVV